MANPVKIGVANPNFNGELERAEYFKKLKEPTTAPVGGDKLPNFNGEFERAEYFKGLIEMRLPKDALEVIGYGHPMENPYHNVRYRANIYLYGCMRSLKLKGDLVDFGSYHGIFPYQFHRKINIHSRGKRHFLFDTWGKEWELQDDPEKKTTEYRYSQDIYDEVSNRFSRFPGVKLIRGLLPESADILDSVSSLSFACVDVNAGSTLESTLVLKVWEKLSTGAMLYIDDYGFEAYPKLSEWLNEFSSNIGSPIFELPMGSGFIIKS